MSAYILSNALVYLKDILPITAGVGATFRISPDLERGLDINTGGVNAFFVLKSSTQIERYLITAVGGVATIVKRGLEQDGITENANLKKSWGDGSVGYITVKPDDFIALGKLDTSGGLRDTMGTAQNIGATNGSTAITVANTTGWANGASITGTGIPGGTTIVSFVPNTSAVLSANFTGTTGTVSVIVGIRYALEVDSSLNEVKKPISNGNTISPTETFRKRKAGGEYEEVAYSVILADMAVSSGSSATITPYESSIILNDLVGITEDGLFECQTENGSSVNITGSTINVLIGQANIDATRTLFLFSVTTQAYACVGTLSGNVMSYGTAVSVATIATNNFSGACILVDTDKVAIVTNDTGTQVIRNRIATIAGNVVTLGTEYTQTVSAGGGGNNIITGCVKVRTTAYAYSVRTPTGFYQATFVQTLSGTVVTTNNTAINPTPAGNAFVFASQNVIQLANNRIAMMMYNNNAGTDFRAFVFDVNPSGTNATTTYTFSGDLGGQVSGAWLARLSDTEFVATFGSIVQSVDKFSISGGSLLRTTAFVAALGSFYPVVEISSGFFGVIIGTTINVYDIKGVLVGTITGITALPFYNQMKMRNARFVYLNGANGTTRIINFARIFRVGVATNATGGVKFYGVQSYTGILPNQKYYIQDNGSIGLTPTLYQIGKGIATDVLLISQ